MKISKEEQKLTQRIFMLRTSLSLLNHGIYPFHEEAKKILRKHINELMNKRLPDIKNTGEGKVVHCKKSSFDIYIGRNPDPIAGKWGNPFTHIKDKRTQAEFTVETREEAIEKYRKWILTQPQLMNSLHELKNKTLGCWCKPQSCHGDVLLELIKTYCK